MTILELIKANPELAKDVKIEVRGSELLEFFNNIKQEEEEYLTQEQLAEKLQISFSTVSNWDKRGITKPLMIGGAKRYRKSDLNKLK